MLTLRLRIGELMREKGINVRQLSELASISKVTARQLAGGYQTRIDLTTLDKVATGLKISPIELFEVVTK
jgi:putative transcriptional regulator